MLLKDFYKVDHFENQDEINAVARITLNAEHDIFKGHFPNNPITPGVCMLQIIKELSETASGASLALLRSKNVKFSAIVNPEVNPNLSIQLTLKTLTEKELDVLAAVHFDTTLALKVQAVYKRI